MKNVGYKYDKDCLVVVDIETTGLKRGHDEIISIAICDGNGQKVFDEYIKPTVRKSWPRATKINGISPADLNIKQPFSFYKNRLQQIFDDANLIVGYNIEFDYAFLSSAGLDVDRNKNKTFDVMTQFALVHGRRSFYRKKNWRSLVDCAQHYGYKSFQPHVAFEDVKATLYCFDALLKDPDYIAILTSD